ncbi:MAG: hypothetical protein QF921_12580 [Pseudomonadales bacterium]|jgi:DNA-binding ferritin-like protein (Dps family)|nr:hypothetical protein [Pseudomonadales bacterium]MDP6470802.1 hypothetical protein [Pseudomonadales bacterium]MDP6828246.1 hypothetical protein [Pseudomonadales bacterium]MDP6972325.1 hypothetical protein [Pseudomonadales bacterium]|tara:strand:- start:2098 stop:3720 length:1623 start_codon:yes stop_codon:yes gene_type:complete
MSDARPVVHLFPCFESDDHLIEQLARVAWYIFPLDPQVILSSRLEWPDVNWDELGFTPEVGALYSMGQPEWVRFEAMEMDEEALRRADIILLWQGVAPLEALAPGSHARLIEEGVAVYDVDRSDRTEGAGYIDVTHRFARNDESVIERSRALFGEAAQEWRALERAYLFCSGPEIRKWQSYDFAEGINIYCNSVINDTDLSRAVPPDLEVFGDPIFHFGCSAYANEFRNKLMRSQARYGYKCVIPIKYYNLFVYWQPYMQPHTVALPFKTMEQPNLDLLDEFSLSVTDNILTFLMLPIATTLASEVYLLGCDGRPLEDNKYFWNHNEKTQFADKMEVIQRVHASFFTVDYDDYYQRHCDNVETYLSLAEQTGIRFAALTPSFIPALEQREHPHARDESGALEPAALPKRNGEDTTANKVVSGTRMPKLEITPDVETFGGDWERAYLSLKGRLADVEYVLETKKIETRSMRGELLRANDQLAALFEVVNTLSREIRSFDDLKLAVRRLRLVSAELSARLSPDLQAPSSSNASGAEGGARNT